MTAISKVKETLSTLSSSESTLKIYSLQERDKKSKAIYAEASEEINKIKADIEKRVGVMEFQEPQYKGN